MRGGRDKKANVLVRLSNGLGQAVPELTNNTLSLDGRTVKCSGVLPAEGTQEQVFNAGVGAFLGLESLTTVHLGEHPSDAFEPNSRLYSMFGSIPLQLRPQPSDGTVTRALRTLFAQLDELDNTGESPALWREVFTIEVAFTHIGIDETGRIIPEDLLSRDDSEKEGSKGARALGSRLFTMNAMNTMVWFLNKVFEQPDFARFRETFIFTIHIKEQGRATPVSWMFADVCEAHSSVFRKALSAWSGRGTLDGLMSEVFDTSRLAVILCSGLRPAVAAHSYFEDITDLHNAARQDEGGMSLQEQVKEVLRSKHATEAGLQADGAQRARMQSMLNRKDDELFRTKYSMQQTDQLLGTMRYDMEKLTAKAQDQEKRLAAVNETMQARDEEIDRLKGAIAERGRELSEKNKELIEKNKELIEKAKEAAERAKEAEQLKKMAADLQRELEGRRKAEDDAARQLEAERRKGKAMEDELNALKKKCGGLADTMHSTEGQVDKLRQELAAEQARLQKAQSDLDEAGKERARAEHTIRGLEGARAQLEDELRRLQRKLESQQQEWRDEEERRAQADRKVVSLSDELTENKKLLSRVDREKADLAQALKSAEWERDNLQHDLREAVDRQRQSDEMRRELERRLGAKERECDQLEADLADEQEKARGIEDQLRALKERTRGLEGQVAEECERAQRSVSDLERALGRATSDLEAERERHRECQDQCTALSEELRELGNQLANERRVHDKELREGQDRIVELEMRLATSERESKDAQGRILRAEEQRREMQSTLEETRHDLTGLRWEVEKLQKDVQLEREAVKRADDTVHALQDELRKTREQHSAERIRMERDRIEAISAASTMQSEKEVAEQDAMAARGMSRKLEEECRVLHEKLKALGSEKERLQRELDLAETSAKRRLAEADWEHQRLKDDLKAQLERCAADLQRAKDELTTFRQTALEQQQMLKKELQASRDESRRLAEAMRDSSPWEMDLALRELEGLEEEVSFMQARVTRLEATARAGSDEVQEARKRLQATMHELEQLRARSETSRHDAQQLRAVIEDTRRVAVARRKERISAIEDHQTMVERVMHERVTEARKEVEDVRCEMAARLHDEEALRKAAQTAEAAALERVRAVEEGSKGKVREAEELTAKVRELEEHARGITAQHATLQEDARHLRDQLLRERRRADQVATEAADSRGRLQQDLDEALKRNTALLDEVSREREGFMAQVDTLHQQLQAAKDDVARATRRAEHAEISAEQLRDRLGKSEAEAKERINRQHGVVAELEKRVALSEDLARTARQDLEAEQRRGEDCRRQFDAAEESLQAVRGALEDMASGRAVSSCVAGRLTGGVAAVSRRLRDMANDLERVRSERTRLEGALQEAETRANSAAAEAARAASQANEHTQQILVLKEKLVVESGQAAETMQRCEELQATLHESRLALQRAEEHHTERTKHLETSLAEARHTLEKERTAHLERQQLSDRRREDLQETIAAAAEEADRLRRAKAEAERRVDELTKELHRAESTRLQLESRCTSAEVAERNAAAALERAQEKAAEAYEESRRASSALADHQQKQAEARRTVHDLERRVEALSSKLQSSDEALKGKEQEVDYLRGTLRGKEEDIEFLRTSLRTEEEARAAAESASTRNQQKALEVEASAKRTLEDLSQQLEDAEGRALRAERAEAELRSATDRYTQDMYTATRASDNIKAELEKEKQSRKETEKRYSDLMEANERLHARVKEAEKRLREEEQTKGDFEQELIKAANELEARARGIQKQADESQSEMAALKKKLREAESEVVTLRDRLTTAETRLARCNAELETSQTRYERRLEVAEEGRRQAVASLASSREAARKAEQRAAESEARLVKLQENLTNLEHQLSSDDAFRLGSLARSVINSPITPRNLGTTGAVNPQSAPAPTAVIHTRDISPPRGRPRPATPRSTARAV